MKNMMTVPRATIWTKVNGKITAGLLTTNMALVPLELQPTSNHPKIRGYRRAYCLNRGRWVSFYVRSVMVMV